MPLFRGKLPLPTVHRREVQLNKFCLFRKFGRRRREPGPGQEEPQEDPGAARGPAGRRGLSLGQRRGSPGFATPKWTGACGAWLGARRVLRRRSLALWHRKGLGSAAGAGSAGERPGWRSASLRETAEQEPRVPPPGGGVVRVFP